MPYIIKNAFTKVFKPSKRSSIVGMFGLLFVLFMICLVSLTGYQTFNTRFMLVAVVLASPVLVYSYDRNFSIYKLLISAIAIFLMVKVTFFNPIRPILPLITYGGDGRSILFSTRDEIRYTRGRNSPYSMIKYMLDIAPNYSKIAFIADHDNWYYLFYPHNPTYQIYPLKFTELAEKENFNDYDFIIVFNNPQITYNENAKKPVYIKNTIDFSLVPKNFKIIPFRHGQPQDWAFYECVILQNSTSLMD